MAEPIVSPSPITNADPDYRFSATGKSFAIREWRGSGPAKLHVHQADDEAWHVIEGLLHFRFVDRELAVEAGQSVFVPAGVAHTYEAISARYLVVLTPRLLALIEELQHTSGEINHAAIYQKYQSQLLE
ncbi:MAG TPA: cupin domain-containing protein [Gemmatimonadaceae bacterium]|jgi:mannose-6-phosphate isomerase-like protein (cupin superfamily)